MKFAPALLPIAAALQFVEAGPVAAEGLTKRAPVPVRSLFCDGDSKTCTATLRWGDGRWFADWPAKVIHQRHFGYATEEMITTIAPVPVSALVCDGDGEIGTCTAKLDFGDGHYFAQWNAKVSHNALFGHEVIDAMAPVPVKRLTCDGDSKSCTADLDFADGEWEAYWDAHVSHY